MRGLFLKPEVLVQVVLVWKIKVCAMLLQPFGE